MCSYSPISSASSDLPQAIELINQNISYLNTHPKRKNIEEQTKQSLILPLLSALGYNIFLPQCVQMESQSVLNPSEHIDYAVQSDDTDRFYIEAKHLDYNLDATYQQLNKYFQGDTSTKIAIATDGNEYRFYTDTQNKNILDSTPYYTLKVNDLSPDDTMFLASFANGVFSESKHQKFALKRRIYEFANSIQRSDLLTCGFVDLVNKMNIESSYLFEHGIDKADEVSLCYEDKTLYHKQMFDIISHASINQALHGENSIANISEGNDQQENMISDDASKLTHKKKVRDLRRVPEDVIFIFDQKDNAWNGKMKVLDGKCIVLAESKLGKVTTYYDHKKNRDVYPVDRSDMAEFLKVAEDGTLILLIDTDGFETPSAAGAFVSGKTANGWVRWKDENGKTLEEYALEEN